MTDITDQISSQLVNTVSANIDTGMMARGAAQDTQDTYVNTSYYLRILWITFIVLVILCLLFSCTTFWANYVVITNHNATNEMLRMIEESEKLDRPIHDYTYRSRYNYYTLGQIERIIYDEYSKARDAGIESIALEDIRIENSRKVFDAYASSSPDQVSPLMASLIADSWLSASNPSYILDKFNTHRVFAEFFINSKDADALRKSQNLSESLSYEVEVPDSEIIVVIKYHVYDYDAKNRVFQRRSTQNPGTILKSKVMPYHTIDIPDRGQIRTFELFKSIAKQQKKPYLFYYWQNEKGNTPAHIRLSHQTIEKNCQKSFDLVKLDEKNIYDYLPELKPHKKRLEEFSIANRVDVYRVFLLYKYGGLYLDSDTVVLKDLKDLVDPLSTIQGDLRIEYVGFGCTGKTCKNNGYMRPSNGLMGARRGAFIMHDIQKTFYNFLLDPNSKLKSEHIEEGERTYFLLGKNMIWFILDSMVENHPYRYFHIDPHLLGIRDKNGDWVTNKILFDTKGINYKDEDSMYMVIFYNSEFRDPDLMRSIKDSDILDSKMEIARFFKRALK